MTAPLPESDAGPDNVLPDLGRFARPRLRNDVPLLWRTQTSIQIGDDVVVERVNRSLVAWMTSLDGLQSPADVVESLTIPEHEARRLVRALVAAGALDDAADIPDALRWCPAAQRDTATARFGAALRTYRDLDAAYAAIAGRDLCRVAVAGDGPLADAVRDSLEPAGLRLDDDRPTCAVLADSPHPDVPARFDHPLMDIPHLQVGVLGDRATVGPLVVPGQTGCLRCTHLHRRDADAAWPLLAVQWSQAVAGMATPPVDPLLVRLAAAQAVVLLRAWVDRPGEPDAWADHALDIRLPTGESQRRARPAHPLCGCRWDADWRDGAPDS